MRSSISLAMVLCLFSVSVYAQYTAVTATNLSPYSRGADESLPGFNHELLEEISKRSGVDINIEYLPWKRAQKRAQSDPNTLIFGITRNAAREPLYDWITHMLTNETIMITTGEKIDSLEEAATLGKIGAFAPRFRGLKSKGWKNIVEGPDSTNFKKLDKGRIDAVYTLASRAVFVWDYELGLNPDKLVMGESIDDAELWLAAHPGFPTDDRAKIAAAYTEIRDDGFYEKLHQKYFGALPVIWDLKTFQ